MQTSPKVLGQKGEEAAGRWYADHGYRIVARNWRTTGGEIDLIAERHRGTPDETIVFCEVKTRSSTRYGLPSEAVGRDKQARLRRLAASWLADNPGRRSVRFDVASVINTRVEVIEDAF